MKNFLFIFLTLIGFSAVGYSQCTPTFTSCPSNITGTSTAGSCGGITTYSQPTFTGCPTGELVQTSGLPSGSSFPQGVTTNTFNVANNVTLFSETFANNAAGWTLDTEWAIGPATTSTCPTGNQDPGTDHTPTSDNGVAGVVIGGCASTTIHPFYYLTSPIVNAASATNLKLEFYRWLNSDYTPYMQNTVEVYNGTAWVVVWQTGGSPGVSDNAWNLQSYDISVHANANLRVRFGFNVNNGGAFTISQWNLDDVAIISKVPTGVNCSFTVTYPDVAPLVANCSSNITVPVTAGANCEAVVNFTAPTATDCGPLTTTLVSGMPSGSAFPVGTTAVTYLFEPTQTVYFSESFANNTAGWTLGNEWAIGSAAVSSCPQGNDPATDNTPTSDNGVAGVVLGGCANTVIHPFYYLTSPVINMSTATGAVELQFYRWLTSDYTPYMQNIIEVFDGTAWQTIWITGSSPGVVDLAWVYQNFDVTPYLNANFQFRFGFLIGSSGVFTVGSWNIDDVKLASPAGLSSTCSFDITVTSTLAQSHTVVQPNCATDLGAITVTTSGGLTPVAIDSMGNNFAALNDGMMYYNVHDGAGCIIDDSVEINVPTPITTNPTLFQPVCSTDFGTASLNMNGGTGNLNVLWDNPSGSTVAIVNDLLNGYTDYTITDDNGCTYTDSVLINTPPLLLAPATTSHICLPTTNAGSATVVPSGGVPGYTISWPSSGSTAFSQSGLTAGNYAYNLTDSNGCTINGTATILSSNMVLSAVTTDELISNDGTVDLSVTGGMMPYVYSWSNSATTQDLSGLAAGSYTVTITDSIGCVKTGQYVVGSQVGLSETALNKVLIYPNPNDGNFMIKTNNQVVRGVKVFDAQGRVIYTLNQQLGDYLLVELTNVEHGMYHVQLIGQNSTIIQQVVIK